jgi:phosphoglucosamine mutase
MAERLFGTDGLRGTVNTAPMTVDVALRLGLAAGVRFRRGEHQHKVVIGKDTRLSGYMLESALTAGLCAAGMHVIMTGPLPTPAISFLTRSMRADLGVVISASHNPFQDNGIKVFGHSGYKLPDRQEHALEAEILALLDAGTTPSAVTLTEDPGLDRSYLDYLASTFAYRLDGLRIAVDCANGAATHLAPELLQRLGASVRAIHCSPDGRNINLGCGALHPETLARAVRDEGASIGVALDGDADRAIFVSAAGRVVDGDAVLLIAARHLLEQGRLPGPGGQPAVVATVMSNLGLEKALAGLGIRMLRTAVGDKYVLEEMVRAGATLGGEQSGHIIFHEHATTGDGLLTTLRVLEAMLVRGQSLDELAAGLQRYPQRLVNIRVRERRPLEEIPEVAAEIRAAEEAFGDSGRVLVRYSGTELLARVMIEAADADLVRERSERIADAIRQTIGA